MPTAPPAINNVTVTSQQDDGDVHEATTVINAFMPWLLIVAGSVCNVLIILGMRTSKFRSLSTSVFMTVGAVNDLLSLLILLTAHWVHLNFPASVVRTNGADFLCKFFNFYGWGQADLGIMLMSAMTADRAYAIVRPLTSVDLVKRAKIVIAVCLAVVAAKEFHFWFTSVMVDRGRQDRLCDVDYNVTSYYQFYVHYWPWLDTVFVTLCFLVMVASNTIIIRHVQRSRQGRQIQTKAGGPGPCRSSSAMTVHGGEYEGMAVQVTRMLLAESLAFILLSYPFSLHLVVTSLTSDLHPHPHPHHQDTDDAQALVFGVVFYLLYANKCVTFLVYCLAGQRFRRAIVTDVLCRLSCQGCRVRLRQAVRLVESDATHSSAARRGDRDPQHSSDSTSQL